MNEFVIYSGPMWASKTSSMLDDVDTLRRKGYSVLLFKPSVDSRYSDDHICTHNGEKIAAVSVPTADVMMEYIASDSCAQPDYVCVDEAFMLPGIGDALPFLFCQGVNIIVASLDLGADCLPLKEMKQLLPYATRIEKKTAVCSVCRADARYTYRKTGEIVHGELAVGGDEMYEPRCWVHHPLINRRDTE